MNIKDATDRMDKSFNLLVDQYRTLHFGGSGAFLDTIRVEYYGSMTPLVQLASVTSAYRGKYTVRPHDSSCLKDIERAILKANLGVGVSSDKTGVHVTVPMMSMEQKEKMVGHVSNLANEAKVAVRKIRQDARKQLQKAKLAEDIEKKTDKELQKFTDEYCEKIDKLCASKSKVIME